MTQCFYKYGKKGYVLQFDIHHYFPAIDHDVLKEKLRKMIKDEDISNLLFSLIDSYHEENRNTGLPMGNQTSQCFALIYLDGVDRLIKEKYRMKYYSRYMDDGIIISESKEKLRELLRDIKEACLELKLELNPKTQRWIHLSGISISTSIYRKSPDDFSKVKGEKDKKISKEKKEGRKGCQ